MKRTIYLGMNNKPHEVFEIPCLKNFKVTYQYKNNAGKKVMLKAIDDNPAYYPPHNFVQYPNNLLPVCRKSKLYPISILYDGYSGHYFEIVEI